MFVLGIINHIAGCRTSDKKRSVLQGTSGGEVHSGPRVQLKNTQDINLGLVRYS